MGMKTKSDIITFKADEALADKLRAMPNRSEFIRAAVLAAMEHLCPLCGGSGILTPDQREHWISFASDHAIEECGQCHAFHLVCHSRRSETQRSSHRKDE